ncbi:MAG: ATP-binding cassette domain-containing protein [Bacteroidetes bacterium]|nr:ATP-binding cassette domain-containing protein [Bacteroidota bacterium]HNR20727.1 ATP-binding cassette domain-containing protein [Bacteroidia bacterium]HNU33097.1 ATP-binding cassette domain-containing protein [Bacteroidia bacterium]
MPILSVQNVTKKYASHTALNNVSLEVEEGSVFGLLGPNGAGKTSLIRIINQITGPDSGSILLLGKKLNPDLISEIGYLPEERGLYKKMAVGEQALYLSQLKGMSKNDALKKLKFWFEKFEIKQWWNKKIEELSKGMQQKVQFIVTVLHEPKLLILDEPFTGFDPINANLIKDELLQLKAKGTSIILSTHRMESVEELCTHIGLINKSEKVLDGSVKEIRKKFKSNLYEIEYKGNAIGFANALWSGFELVESKNIDGTMHAVVRNINNASPNDLLKILLPDVEILSFKERIPSMNDIFISAVSNTNPQH